MSLDFIFIYRNWFGSWISLIHSVSIRIRCRRHHWLFFMVCAFEFTTRIHFTLLFSMFRQPMTLLLLLSTEWNIRHAFNFLQFPIILYFCSYSVQNRFSFHLISFYLSKMNNIRYLKTIHTIHFQFHPWIWYSKFSENLYKSIIATKNVYLLEKRTNVKPIEKRDFCLPDLSFYSHLVAFSRVIRPIFATIFCLYFLFCFLFLKHSFNKQNVFLLEFFFVHLR